MEDVVFFAFLWRIEVGVILDHSLSSVQDNSLLDDQRKSHWQHLDELRQAVLRAHIGVQIYPRCFLFEHADMAEAKLHLI